VNGEPAVHWLVYGIPNTVRELPENAAATMKFKQGVNYLGQNTYAGPKPKPGSTARTDPHPSLPAAT